MGKVATLVLVFIVSTAGCHRRQYGVESVTRGRDGNIWVSGTDGLAGYFDRDGFTRADYRCGRRDFRGAYHTYMDMPASQIALYRGEPYLFTRRGEVSRWGGEDGWQELRAQLSSTVGSEYPQINVVFEAPDGRLLIQIHSDLLVWTTPAELESGQYAQERTPTFFTSLAFVGDTLYGIGYRDSGEVPVMRRREGPGSWPEVARLPADIHIDSFHGIIRWGNGAPALVASTGLLFPANGEMEMVAVQDLLRRAGRQVPQSTSYVNVARIVRMAGGAPLLQIGGSTQAGLLASVNEQTLAFWPCDLPALAGGVTSEGRSWLVTREGAIYELGDGQCPLVHAAVVPAG